ncbi:MAG: hypothetical protein L3K07_08605 [Thermoplasmata archaeon]|nr:hypothetical protein [Thermoplasmata archaeon]
MATSPAVNMVPLLLADTALTDAAIEGVYKTNYEGLRELRALADQPPVAVTDPLRLAGVRTLLGGLLDLLDHTGLPAGRDARIAGTNLMYDTLIISLDQLKGSLDLPRVPQGRRAK